ncbi:TPA: hypothetical protein ACH3X1_014234 [Trebouxia sp. C0004]
MHRASPVSISTHPHIHLGLVRASAYRLRRPHAAEALSTTHRCGCGQSLNLRYYARLHAPRKQSGRQQHLSSLVCHAEKAVEDMLVLELREELKLRQLPYSGRKAELQETLAAARQDEGPLSQLQQQPKQHNWSDLTSEQIRSQLQLRELATSGLKSALLERITEAAGPEVVLVDPSDPDAVAAAKAAAKAAALQDQSGYAESPPIESPLTNATDLSSYKASELKEELNRLGLPSTGSRQQLEERLMQHYETAQDAQYEALAAQVESMSTTELQQQLQARNINTQGLTKFDLQDSLWASLQAEAGLLPAEDAAAIDTELGEQLEFSTPAAQAPPKVRDPPTLVALLCGGPVAGQQQSLTSAQTYLQQLQTHNPREGFQGDESVPMPNSNGGPETNGSDLSGSETNAYDGRLRGQPLQKRKDLTGIHFVPYFITSGLQAMPITAAELHGKSAATLEFESGLNRREVLSLQQLSQQLKAAADVALSTVPSKAGQLTAALEEAGVPFVGSPFEATQTASHKYRCHQRMVDLELPVLPMCHLHWSDFYQQGTSEQEEGTSEQEEGTSEQEEDTSRWQTTLEAWMDAYDLSMDLDSFVVKPAENSNGKAVLLVNSMEGIAEHAQYIFDQDLCESVVVEPYQASSECVEFSVTVLGSSKGPVVLLPTEVESYYMEEDLLEAALDFEAYKARQEGFDQEVIDSFLDDARGEMVIAAAGGRLLLNSPFTNQQPSGRRMQYHTPARFSQQVVQGIRHAAGKLFKELGLEDIARMDGWVRTTQPEPQLSNSNPALSSSEEGQVDVSSSGSTDSSSDSDSPQPQDSDSGMLPPQDSELSTESTLHDQPQLPKPIEYLSDDMYTYSAAPTASSAVPIWSAEYSASGDFSSYDMLGQPNAEAASSELQAAEAESADMASVSTDSEEDEEGSLLDRWYAVHPDELCRHGPDTVFFSGVHVNPSLEPTSVIFQQAADMGMSHSALLRHVLSRACIRAGLPPIPPPIAQDITKTALVPYAQVNQDGEEIDLDGAVLLPAESPYAEPWLLAGPTPMGRIPTTVLPAEPSPAPEAGGGVPGPIGGQFGQQWDEQQFAPPQPAYQYGSPDALPQEYASTSGYGEGYGEEAVTKVWVLMGGEGLQRQHSLRSGLHACLMLQDNSELQVEPFLLSPLGFNLRERGRRKDLLRQRSQHIKLGVHEDALPQELQLSYIKNPPPPSHNLAGRFLWAVPYPLMLRNSVEDVHAACELAQHSSNMVDRMLTDSQRGASWLRREVQRELKYAEVEGPGSLWGSTPMTQNPVPRLLDLQSFASEAREAGAVVLNTLHAELGDNGFLQAYLEQKEVQVLHTGSDSQVTALCHDKVALSEHLKTLEVYHISTIPKCRLPLLQLYAAANDTDVAETLFQELRRTLGDTPELCIKPAMGSWGLHRPLPCIATSEDLMLYALALQDRWPRLPPDFLSTPHAAIDLPPAGNQQLMVEPFIHVARLVAVPQQQGGPQIQWEGESRWIAISSALLGEVGRMQVLTPTILVHPPSDPPSDLAQASDVTHTSGVTSPGSAEAIAMTPPPPEFLPPDIIAAAKQWMTMAADRLAIAGAAHMDAFVHADKGEIIIIDVHSVPDLSQDSLLLQQALVEQPPVHPNDVLREVVDLAQLPISQDTFDEDPQLQYDSQIDRDEDEELLDPGLDLQADDAQPDTSYGQQTFQPAQEFDNSGQAQNSGGAGWTDDSFTDAALDDDTFDPSGFTVVQKS